MANKKTEEKTTNNHKEFQTLVEQAPLSIQIMDPAGKTLQVNKAWEKLWGIKLKDLKDYNILKDKQLVRLGLMKYIESAFGGRASFVPAAEYDTVDTLGKGHKKWVQARIYPVKDKEGKMRRVVLMHEDISKQKNAEKELKEYKDNLEKLVKEKTRQLEEREGLYEALVQTSPNCVKLFDTKGKLVFVNNSGLAEHRLKSLEEALKKNWSPLSTLIKEDRPKFAKAMKDAVERGKISAIEIRHTKAGSVREICSEIITPVKDKNGKIIGIFGVSVDISKEKKITEELIKNEEKFRVLTESSPDCIKLFDLKGNLKYINKGGLNEHGLKSLDEALKIGWQAIETVVAEDRSKFKKALEEAAKGKTSSIEIRHTREGANREVCSELIAPIRNEKGEIAGVFGVSRDISGIKKTEKELRDIKENLEKKITEQTESLTEQVEKLEKMNSLMVGRELKMIELKKRINELENKLKK